jgi:hypothetical protein
MPVSTHFLTEFARYRAALVAYWLNILLLGAILYSSWGCATHAKLIKDDMLPGVPAGEFAGESSLDNRCTRLAQCCASLALIGASPSSCWCSCTTRLHRACGGRESERPPAGHATL